MATRTLIIAEAGVNHNGDIELARQLVDIAAETGADIVKFQTFKAKRLATAAAKKADYQIRNTGHSDYQQEMLEKLELNRAMHETLIAHCALRRIAFFSTAFDIDSVDLLLSLGQDCFKIPSGEITNLPYLRHIGRLKKRVILSTGMATMDDIAEAIQALERAGTPRVQITVLQCTTEYPASMADVNLRAMQTISDAFGVSVGFSDHTAGIEAAIAAVALGAVVVEKHLTVDRNLPGPDHKASLEPAEFKAMVRAIRNIEFALGDGVKRPSAAEANNRLVARKSLVASQPIKTGELFSAENVTTKRPGTGISPMRWDEIIGMAATRNFETDDLITM